MQPDGENVCTVDQVVRAHVLYVLNAVDFDKTKAARILGISRRSIYRWLERIAPDQISRRDGSQGQRIRMELIQISNEISPNSVE